MFPPGPIILAEHQCRIIDEALSKKDDGTLRYTNIIYSAPKKSGKSALSSAVVLYMAWHNPNAYIACIANDGKQADDRLYGPIQTCFRLHRQLGGIFADVRYTQREAVLPNYAKIEPVNVDAAGEAGAQPMMTAWSELWGYTTPKKMKLWSEFTPPPTLHGRAIRWVESYAGFTGESEILEQLYDIGFTQGEPHPEFDDLQGMYGPVVRTNEAASLFTYWDTEPRMIWQTPKYYREQEQTLTASEFRRLHRNQWSNPADAFIESAWWDACEDQTLPVLQDHDKTPVVVAIDMAVSRDCAAMVAVTRDPMEPESKAAVRAVRIFSPRQSGGIIDQEMLVRPVMEDWFSRYNIVCWAYDPKEMAKLAQDMTRDGFGWFKAFGQTTPRSIADKQLYDMIVQRQISWNRRTTEGDIGYRGDSTQQETLYKHLTQAGAVVKSEAYRLEKLTASLHIDAAVALSMAVAVAFSLAIGNRENEETELIRKLQRREITPQEFTERVQALHHRLKVRESGG